MSTVEDSCFDPYRLIVRDHRPNSTVTSSSQHPNDFLCCKCGETFPTLEILDGHNERDCGDGGDNAGSTFRPLIEIKEEQRHPDPEVRPDEEVEGTSRPIEEPALTVSLTVCQQCLRIMCIGLFGYLNVSMVDLTKFMLKNSMELSKAKYWFLFKDSRLTTQSV